jgi:integrase
MPRRPTGSIVAHEGRDGLTYRALRFTAYGRRRYVPLGAVSHDEAERQLRGILADVERGIWQPREPATDPPPEPERLTFHAFAEQWWIERHGEWRDNTRADYRWRLENHLLPFFAEHDLERITIAEVDRYRAAKLAEADRVRAMIAAAKRPEDRPRDERGRLLRPLSGESINKTLVLLAAILEAAEERELITRNAARGRRRRVKTHRPQRSYLDSADQITALLDAATALDAAAGARYRHVARHALLATLLFAGLRISELLDLRWRDVDLANGRLRIGRAKTEAGVRSVTIRPVLRDVLASLKAGRGQARPDDYVFATAAGRRQSASNVRNRILARAAAIADAAREGDDLPPLPRLTPHSLRRTFASVLYAIGEPASVVMAEMGHANPALALAIYAQAMRRGPEEVARLRALVQGAEISQVERAGEETRPATAPRAHRGQPRR